MAREQFDKYFIRPSGIDNRTGEQTADLTIFNGERLTGVPIVTARHIYKLNQAIISCGLEIGDAFEAQIPRRSIDTKNHKIRPSTWVPTPNRSVTFRGIGPDGISVNDPQADGGSRLLSIDMKDILALRKKQSGPTQAKTGTAESQSPKKDKKLESPKVEMKTHPTPHFVNMLTPDGIRKMIVLSVQNPKGEIKDYVFEGNKTMEGSGDTERELLEARIKRWRRTLGIDVIIGPGIDLGRQEDSSISTIKQRGVFGLYINKDQISGLRDEQRKWLAKKIVTDYQI